MGDYGEETSFCCSVTHARYAQTHITDTISNKISCARSICFLKQRLIPRNVAQRRLSLGTRISVCQRIMETPERLLTGHGKSSKANVCGIFKKKNVVGEKTNSTVRFKTIFFEKFILWEIATRKLDSSPVGIGSRCC